MGEMLDDLRSFRERAGSTPRQRTNVSIQRLGDREMATFKRQSPKETGGDKRKLCLYASCHCGCKNTAKTCLMAHAPLTTTAGLHWTVQAMIIRLGGLKTGKLIGPDEVNPRIDTLRQAAKAADAANPHAGTSW